MPSTPGGSFGPVTEDPAAASPDWPSSGHDWFNTGSNAAETAIAPATVANLTVSWRHGPAFVSGTPVVSDGVVYLADAFGVVYARDAATGAPLWATDVSDATDPFFFASFQSAPVVTEDALFVGDTDAVVYRLDRRNGAVQWATRVDANPNALIQGDPLVFAGQVLVGVSSHENEAPGADPAANLTLRGSIVALDAATGAVAWQTFTTSDQTLEHPKYGAGVGVWSSPAIDPRGGRLFIGTGNFYEPGAADPSPASAGDRDLSDSLLALTTHSGVITQHRQFTAGDVWGIAHPDGFDFDVGTPPNLFSIPAGDGRGRQDVVGVGDKEGTYHVLDRSSLRPVWSRKVSQGSVVGGFQSTAAVAAGVVYVAAHELFDGRSIDAVIPRGAAARFLASPEGGFILQNLCKTNVLALDAATGQTLWSREFIGGATFAPLVVANGVLFTADVGGRLRALDAASGAELFSDRLTLTLPDPGNPGSIIEVGQFVTALSVANGRLYVAHGLPIPGVEPGGVTAYALPPRAANLGTARPEEPGGGGPTTALGSAPGAGTSHKERSPLERDSAGVLSVAILAGSDFNARAMGIARVASAGPRSPGQAPPVKTAREDVPSDGELDHQPSFRAADLVDEGRVAADSQRGDLTAELFDGTDLAAQLLGLDGDPLGWPVRLR